jgi:hypothetical protein
LDFEKKKKEIDMANSPGRPPKAFTVDMLASALALISNQNDGKGITPHEIGLSDYLINKKGSLVDRGYAARANRPPAKGNHGRPCKIYTITDAGAEFLYQNKSAVKAAQPVPAVAQDTDPLKTAA